MFALQVRKDPQSPLKSRSKRYVLHTCCPRLTQILKFQTKSCPCTRENDGSFQVVPVDPFVPRAEKTTSKEIGQATASSSPPPGSDEWEKLIAENAELQVCKTSSPPPGS